MSSSLRLLVLTLNLLNTDVGLSASRLMQLVPGYETADAESGERKFERDIATLRQTGMDVQLVAGNPPRYRIARRSPASVQLEEREFGLLARAANSWAGSPQDAAVGAQAGVIVNKLRAASKGVFEGTPGPEIALEGGAYTPLLHTAIARSQPVVFDYRSRRGRETREVAPWKLIARGKALYLWGFDLNRWDARLFRLSRFRSAPELIAEEEATLPTGALRPRDLEPEAFLVTPTLAVKPGGAPLVRLMCAGALGDGLGEPLATDLAGDRSCTRAVGGPRHDEPSPFPNAPGLPGTWDFLHGDTRDFAVWEAAVLREADEVIVLEPTGLRTVILDHLRRAAAWKDSDG